MLIRPLILPVWATEGNGDQPVQLNIDKPLLIQKGLTFWVKSLPEDSERKYKAEFLLGQEIKLIYPSIKKLHLGLECAFFLNDGLIDNKSFLRPLLGVLSKISDQSENYCQEAQSSQSLTTPAAIPPIYPYALSQGVVCKTERPVEFFITRVQYPLHIYARPLKGRAAYMQNKMEDFAAWLGKDFCVKVEEDKYFKWTCHFYNFSDTRDAMVSWSHIFKNDVYNKTAGGIHGSLSSAVRFELTAEDRIMPQHLMEWRLEETLSKISYQRQEQIKIIKKTKL